MGRRSGQSLFKRAIETSFSLRSVFLRGEAPPYPSISEPFPFSTSYHHPHPPPTILSSSLSWPFN